MPRELITIQVGQCGNQIGLRFWDLALREHAHYNKHGCYDDALSSFFMNVDTRFDKQIAVGDGKGKISSLKARAILIDMEEGVVNETLKGPLGELFDSRQYLTDVSGSGNNWAHGHHIYGPQYHDEIMEKIRRAVELCDSPQSFFLLNSLGGGTGSGLGTFILEALEDAFPSIYRFVTSIFPDEDDFVVTSPYNSVLSLRKLTDHADCVIPVDNQSLIDICRKIESTTSRQAGKIKDNSSLATNANVTGQKIEKPFDKMNNLAANLLLNLTSSTRFEGSLNIDLNEITMNLVPFPRLHYLIPSLSPLFSTKDVKLRPRSLDQMFADAFSKEHQLIKANPRHSRYLACGLMFRGAVEVSDINRNIEKMKPNLDMIYWNRDGFKIGLCASPPVHHNYSMLCLANNCCITQTFQDLSSRFMKLYQRKVYTHHYTKENLDIQEFDESHQSLTDLISEYSMLQTTEPPPDIAELMSNIVNC